MRPPLFRATFDSSELVVDNFAGGGGASTGIEAALGQGAPVRVRLRDPKGGAPEEWPPDLRIRQFPEVPPA